MKIVIKNINICLVKILLYHLLLIKIILKKHIYLIIKHNGMNFILVFYIMVNNMLKNIMIYHKYLCLFNLEVL